jgi:hypothetical protein
LTGKVPEATPKSARTDWRWSEEKTKENWIICEATNTRINYFHKVRIGRVIAWHRIKSQRSFWSSFWSG